MQDLREKLPTSSEIPLDKELLAAWATFYSEKFISFGDSNGVIILESKKDSKRSRWIYRPDLPMSDYWGDYFFNCPHCWQEHGEFKNDGFLNIGAVIFICVMSTNFTIMSEGIFLTHGEMRRKIFGRKTKNYFRHIRRQRSPSTIFAAMQYSPI